MDAIILAAGNGERLAGVMPTGFKPLMVVNGESLIVHVTKRVAEGHPNRIIYVVSPTNAGAIADVLSHMPDRPWHQRFMVQVEPTGPIDATALGLDLVETPIVCVACADNIIPEGLVRESHSLISDTEYNAIVPVSEIPLDDATRYTRVWCNVGGRNVYTDGDKLPSGLTRQYVGAWIGPLVFRTQALANACRMSDTFADVLNRVERTTYEYSTCVDVGVPE